MKPEDSTSGFSEHPYPGLRPFNRDEADIFFGQQHHVIQLLTKLEAHRFIAVVGSSGSGKSSLVRAGLIPALEAGIMASAGPRWVSATMRPGKNPIGNLAQSILACPIVNKTWQKYPNAAEMLVAVLRRGPNGISNLLDECQSEVPSNLLLLVDQFEEIFRYHRLGNENHSLEFVELLLEATRQKKHPIYVVLTMRSDFLGDCSLFNGLPEAINDAQLLVPRLTRTQCREAIVGPAAAFDLDIEEDLVNQILNDMHGDSDQLPLMQHVLMRLWLSHIRGNTQSQPKFTLDAYHKIGGIEHALSNHADEVYRRLSPRQQKIAETLFRCLTERGTDLRDTRRPVSVESLVKVIGDQHAVSSDNRSDSKDSLTQEVIEVINVFRDTICSFLVPAFPAPLTLDSVIDISHESLIRQWDRLREWVEAEYSSGQVYKRMVETARLWKQGKAALWRTPDLESGLAWRSGGDNGPEWAKRYGGEYSLAIDFLQQSENEQNRITSASREQIKRELKLTQRAAARLRLLLALALVLCCISITAAIAGYALWKQQEALRAVAQEARVKAEAERNVADQARRLADEGLAQLRSSNELLSSIFSDIDPYSTQNSDIELRAQLVERIEVAAKNSTTISTTLATAEEQIQTRIKLATAIRRMGSESSAIEILTDAYESVKDLRDTKPLLYIECRNQLALCANYQPIGQSLLDFTEETFRLSESSLGLKHELTLASMHNYALMLTRERRFYKSRDINQMVLDGRKELLGETHPDTILSMQSLAINYEDLLMLDRAVELFEEAIHRREQYLGQNSEEKFDLLQCRLMASLARCYSVWSLDTKAAPIEQKLLEKYRTHLGEDHALTRKCYDTLCWNYIHRREYGAALELAQRITKLRRNKFGQGSSECLASLSMEAYIYSMMGDYSTSAKEYQKVFDLQREIFGQYDLQTIATFCDLNAVKSILADVDSQSPEQIIKACLDANGPDHPSSKYLIERFENKDLVGEKQNVAQSRYGVDFCPSNLAMRLPSQEFPKATCSFISTFDKSINSINDGVVDFRLQNGNRWTAYQSPNEQDWVEVDFGQEKAFSKVALYIYEDTGVQSPVSYSLQCFSEGSWKDITEAVKAPEIPTSNMPNIVTFSEVKANKLRVTFVHSPEVRSGITEMFVSNAEDSNWILRDEKSIQIRQEGLEAKLSASQGFDELLMEEALGLQEIYKRNDRKADLQASINALVTYISKYGTVKQKLAFLDAKLNYEYEALKVFEARESVSEILKILKSAEVNDAQQIEYYTSVVLIIDARCDEDISGVIRRVNVRWETVGNKESQGNVPAFDDRYNLACASVQLAERIKYGSETEKEIAKALIDKSIDVLQALLSQKQMSPTFVLRDNDLQPIIDDPRLSKFLKNR